MNILCISLTPIYRDARVLRQIELLSQFGDVVTVGFGEKPPHASEHLRVPDGLSTLPQTLPGVVKLALRWHRMSERSSPAARWVLEHINVTEWALVVANDARVLDLAFEIANGSPVWADMHEWAPEERTHIASWKLLVAPFMEYLCKRYLPNTALVTTVSSGIVELYKSTFGVQPLLMVNAGPTMDLHVHPHAGRNIRCVHSGAAIHGRGLDDMIRAFLLLPEHFSLDLFLVPGGDGGVHLQELQNLAEGSERIIFREPVTPSDLPRVLNEYDIGVFWIPPTHTNAKLTLPNKFFDYVQARLGLAIGPSEEMVRELTTFNLGVVSRSFEVESLVASLRGITSEDINEWKHNANEAAIHLGFEYQTREVRARLQEILAQKDRS